MCCHRGEDRRQGGPTLIFWMVVMVGAVVRGVGLAFDGMHDLDTMIFDWGCRVRECGLGAGFGQVYGVLSYVLFGSAADLAFLCPRFWWLPFKCLEIAFEAGVFVLLLSLVTRRYRLRIAMCYWLNPWFMIHGAWLGFWDGPHTFFCLAAVLCLRCASVRRGWFGAGIMVAIAAMIKPQGLAYMAIPLGAYVFWHSVLWRRWDEFGCFAGGVGCIMTTMNIVVVLTGGTATAMIANYLSVGSVMPSLCSSAMNVWRPMVRLLQSISGQTGPLYSLWVPPVLLKLLHGLALGCLCGSIASFAWMLARGANVDGLVWPALRMRPAPSTHYSRALLAMLFGSLVGPTFATMGHINHLYAGMVLLIPLIVGRRKPALVWGLMVLLNFYGHVALYQFGRPQVFPSGYVVNQHSVALLNAVQEARIKIPYDQLLVWQKSMSRAITCTLPVEPMLSWLSLMLVAAVVGFTALVVRRVWNGTEDELVPWRSVC